MIKRALGVFIDDEGDGSDDDSCDSATERVKQEDRRKLERRLLPGAARAATSKLRLPEAPTLAARAPDGEAGSTDDSSDDDRNAGRDGKGEDWFAEDSEDSDDEHPQMLTEERHYKQAKGSLFSCKLCPGKVLNSEQDMEAHLKSKQHLKMEKEFERAQALGVDKYVKECEARAEKKEVVAAAGGAAAVRKKRTQDFWDKKREKRKKQALKAQLKTSCQGADGAGSQISSTLQNRNANKSEKDPEKLAYLKRKYEEKKQRRLERRAAACESRPEDGQVSTVPSDGTLEPKSVTAACKPQTKKTKQKVVHAAKLADQPVDDSVPGHGSRPKASKRKSKS